MAQRATPTVAVPAPGSSTQTAKAIGDRAFDRVDKTSAEFFAITYGALVRQMLVDHNESADVVNLQLDQMGERIGSRLIEEYAARSGAPPCRSVAQAAESVAKIGLRMFLGISANVDVVGGTTSQAANDAAVYAVTFDENPLNLFVELPDMLRTSLWYSNILCGVIRGALSQVGFLTTVSFVRDVLRGDDTHEIRIKFQGREKETFKVDVQK